MTQCIRFRQYPSLGILTLIPSISLVTRIWQPRRDLKKAAEIFLITQVWRKEESFEYGHSYVSVSSNAKSSISSSSSVFGGRVSYTSFSKTRWHVEHANSPPHAPSSVLVVESNCAWDTRRMQVQGCICQGPLPSSSMLLSCATSIKFFPISASTESSSPLRSIYEILVVCFAMTPPSPPVVVVVVVANPLRVGICCSLLMATGPIADNGRRKIEVMVFSVVSQC